MISKAQIKDIKALHLPKYRQIYNKFIAEGDKVCIEFLKRRKYFIHGIFVVDGYQQMYLQYLTANDIQITIVSRREMEQMSALKTPSQVLLLLEQKEDDINVLLNNDTSAIYLDGVQDPGNVGTIIRLADWFGISAVIRSTMSADFFTPKVVQSAMGSMVNIKLITSPLPDITKYDRTLVGTYMEGQPLGQLQIPDNAILVMGSEGKGISEENDTHISHKITIPGHSNKVAESLNVGIATGIICAAWKM